MIAIRQAESDLYAASILGLDTSAAQAAYDAANAALVADGGTARKMGGTETAADLTQRQGTSGREIEPVTFVYR